MVRSVIGDIQIVETSDSKFIISDFSFLIQLKKLIDFLELLESEVSTKRLLILRSIQSESPPI